MGPLFIDWIYNYSFCNKECLKKLTNYLITPQKCRVTQHFS